MTAWSSDITRKAPLIGPTVAILACAPLADAAEASDGAPVYKCAVAGGVLYADYPCKGGTHLDLKPGVADPRAVARLERENLEFERRMQAREASAMSAALREEELDARLQGAEAAQASAAGSASPYLIDSPIYGFVAPIATHRSHRVNAHREQVRRHRVVPAHPRIAIARSP